MNNYKLSLILVFLFGCSVEPDQEGETGITPAATATKSNTEIPPALHVGMGASLIVIDSGDNTSPPILSPSLLSIETNTAPVTISQRPDGTSIVNLGQRFVSPLYFHVECDGKISSSHSKPLSKKDSCEKPAIEDVK